MAPATDRVSAAPGSLRPAASVPARGTMQLLAARGCLTACGYAISVILARGLGPAEYGVYGVVLSVLVSLEQAAALGVPGAAAKLIPGDARLAPAVERAAKRLLLAVSVALLGVSVAVAPLLARALGMEDRTALFRLAVLDLPLSGLYFAYQGVLYGHRRFGVLGVSLVVYGLSKLAGVVALLLVGLSVAGALVVNVLATLGVLVYLAARVPAPAAPVRGGAARPLLRVALPFGLYTAALPVLLGVDLWSLERLGGGGPEAVGTYVAALNVARVLAIVPSVLSGVLFASLCRAVARSDEELARRHLQGAMRFALIVLVPACALLALDGREVMVLLYSSAYAAGAAVLGLQLLAFGLFAFLDTLLHALLAAGQHYRAAGLLVALVPVAVAANLALVPRWGAVGAAAALATTIGLGAALAGARAFRRYGALIRAATLARVLAAALVVAALGTQISAGGLWLPVKLTALLGVYGGLLAALRELKWNDLSALVVWRRQPA